MNTISNNTVANTVVTNNDNNLMENKKVVVATRNADKSATSVVVDEGINLAKEFGEPMPTTHGAELTCEALDELCFNNEGNVAESFDFTLECDKPNVKMAYDNSGAYATVMEILNRNSNINVEFKLDKENFHYAWIETRGVAGFKYYLKNEAFNGIIRYLTKGEVTDFDPAPHEYEPAKFTDEFYIMKLFVDKGFTLQLTPLFRERSGYVTGFLPCKKGKITFRIKHSESIVEYLREADQFI